MVQFQTRGLQAKLFVGYTVNMRKNYTTNGNVLFLILIAVGLFAALSYAVSRGTTGGTSTITDEQGRIGAGEILRTMQSIKGGYDFLWNQKGCSIDEISFIKAGMEIGAIDFDADSPKADDSCDMFAIAGAGVNYPTNLNQYQEQVAAGTSFGKLAFWFSGNEPAVNFGITNLGTAANDHIVILEAVRPEICTNLNSLAKIPLPDAEKIDAGTVIGDAVANFAGKTSGCRARASGGPYDAFFVIQEF